MPPSDSWTSLTRTAGIFCSSQRCLVPRPRHHGSHEYDYRGRAQRALLATEGFRDVFESLARSAPSFTTFFCDKPKPLVALYLCYEVPERLRFRRPGIAAAGRDAVRTVARVIKGEAWKRSLWCRLHSTSIRNTNSGRRKSCAKGSCRMFSMSLFSDLCPKCGNTSGLAPDRISMRS